MIAPFEWGEKNKFEIQNMRWTCEEGENYSNHNKMP